MSNASSNNLSVEPSDLIAQFEQIHNIVESEFAIEEGFVEHDVPTFYLQLREDSKECFLRLLEHLKPLGLVATLRKKDDKIILRIVSKPHVKPSRPLVNWALFLATLGTVLFAGYWQSMTLPNPVAGAVMFAGAIMGILGSHEMGHKLLADKHGIEATYPYFIPGIPPIGTFGAVIQQKSLPQNKDALFDLGASGPIVGFIVTIVVLMIGVSMSNLEWITSAEMPPGALPFSLLLEFFTGISLKTPPRPTPAHTVLLLHLHPVARAGFIGLLVTMLNLLPTGMLDGGHTVRSLLGGKAHSILLFVSLAILFLLGSSFWLFAFLVLIFSMYRHPGPLDDVSKLTTSRKLVALVLVIIFIISMPRTLF